MKAPKIIYFIDGPVPSPADKAEANALRGKGVTVVFRNSRYVEVEGGVDEPADGVTGAVIPASYAKHTTAETVVAAFQAKLAAELAAVHPLSAQLATGGAAGAPVTVVADGQPTKAPGAFTATPGAFTTPVPKQ